MLLIMIVGGAALLIALPKGVYHEDVITDFSLIADNPEPYYSLRTFSEEFINGSLVRFVYSYQYTDAVVVYMNWSIEEEAGIIVFTGTDQISNQSYTDIIIYYSQSLPKIDSVSVGDIVQIDDPEWSSKTKDDETLHYLSKGDFSITGQMNMTEDSDLSNYVGYLTDHWGAEDLLPLLFWFFFFVPWWMFFG